MLIKRTTIAFLTIASVLAYADFADAFNGRRGPGIRQVGPRAVGPRGIRPPIVAPNFGRRPPIRRPWPPRRPVVRPVPRPVPVYPVPAPAPVYPVPAPAPVYPVPTPVIPNPLPPPIEETNIFISEPCDDYAYPPVIVNSYPEQSIYCPSNYLQICSQTVLPYPGLQVAPVTWSTPTYGYCTIQPTYTGSYVLVLNNGQMLYRGVLQNVNYMYQRYLQMGICQTY